jgi:hypothetical protein
MTMTYDLQDTVPTVFANTVEVTELKTRWPFFGILASIAFSIALLAPSGFPSLTINLYLSCSILHAKIT